MTRRKTTRVYHTAKGIVELVKEWNWAPKSYVWLVLPYTDEYPKIPLGKFASFAEAKQFIKGEEAERQCDCCGVELSADPPLQGEHPNLCHQCNQDEGSK